MGCCVRSGLHYGHNCVGRGVSFAREPLNVCLTPLMRSSTPQHACGRRCPRAHHRVNVRNERPTRISSGPRALLDRCGVAASRAHRGPGSWTHLLAPLTRLCSAKPYWWHGGQPAQATTYRVNVRIQGPRPPPIGLTCAVTGTRTATATATATATNQSNFACNSLAWSL